MGTYEVGGTGYDFYLNDNTWNSFYYGVDFDYNLEFDVDGTTITPVNADDEIIINNFRSDYETYTVGDITPYTVPDVVEVPEGLKVEEFYFTADDVPDGTRKVAIDAANGKVYVQGLSAELPEAWVVGDVNTDDETVTFAANQYIGQNDEGETSVTGIATNITKNSATITAFANGILDNLATDIRIGIIYTSNGTPTRSNGTIVDVNANTIATDGSYSIVLNGLIPETTYYYRSFVYQSGIWFYGNTRSFTTSGSGELFTTGAASSVTCFSASVAASVNVDSSSPYTSMTYGICYGTSIDPTTDSQHTVATNRDASTGEFTAVLRGLYGGTTYYYRPYAVIDGITRYGQSSQFRTLDDNVVETLECKIGRASCRERV